MIRVLLIHANPIPHYRVPIYNYLSSYLEHEGFEFFVLSSGIQFDCPHKIYFQYKELHLSIRNISRFVLKNKIEIIIDFMELKHYFLFPIYFIVKEILGKKIIYWGQGCDLFDRSSKIKNLAYKLELAFSDAIILYAEHLKKYVPSRFHKKIFIANNTLFFNSSEPPKVTPKENILNKYGIKTKKNIICIGRMQKRKRITHLEKAFTLLRRPDIGLILVGPDPEGVLDGIEGDNIFKLGPIYGDKMYELLSSADVYCLPGAVGLSIIDAFHCGLPFITEEGDESAEIIYLKDSVNGFIVPKGNIAELANKLRLLLDNDSLRKEFSNAAKNEIRENGNIDILCSGFRDALLYVSRNNN